MVFYADGISDVFIVIDGLICPKTTELYCPNLAEIYVRQSYGILSV